MPIRRRPSGPDLELYRNLRFGDLLNLHVLDTRQHRSDQPCGGELGNCEERLAESQTMTGAEQERWLLQGLATSGARWDVLAQQTIFAEIDFNASQPGSVGPAGLFNLDQWDGYAAQRRRIADLLAGGGAPRNTVVLTGDFHASFVNDVKVDYDDPGSPTVATEFVGTSISSDFGDEGLIGLVEAVTSSPDNAHIKDFDGRHRGYVACRVDRDTWTADYRIVSTTEQPTATASTRAVWVVEDGRPGAVPA
jgi:alkaline phosphatase D